MSESSSYGCGSLIHSGPGVLEGTTEAFEMLPPVVAFVVVRLRATPENMAVR